MFETTYILKWGDPETICSKCKNFQRSEKKVSCAKGVWENATLKDALLFTPWDYECLTFEKKEKKEKVVANDSTS